MSKLLVILLTLCMSYDSNGGKVSGYRKRALPPTGEVLVYTEENYKGTSEAYTLPKYLCVEIDPSFLGHISSIYPARGTCVQVFRGEGCPTSERPRKLKEHDFGTDALVKINLNDNVSSLKLCD